ncbi:hypothetical protein A1F94_008301 [Pyrenophora tritici-repentis]|uniref:Uncharacterized protein n=1 Tax=Pyrenophora tritici-repentis TaxID=45151 RepID=A0A922SSR8_9PLEO|nr:hypothetical protein A1F94_008301 [Pyrenophora tritici-repentis]KAI1516236.1 hypothetical protein Ptr86124_004773 [Pyrenophora tritici-repentis]
MSTSKSSWLDSYRLQITDNIEARAQWHVPENGNSDNTTPIPVQIPVQQMISLPISGVSALTAYLHYYPSTVADVEALVSAFIEEHALMDKLAENIGYFSVYGFITPVEIAYFNHQASLQDLGHQGLEHIEPPVRTESKKSKKTKNAPKHQTPASVRHAGYPTGESFAQTRLHNGPGLYDKKATFCLPKNDTREV